MLLLAVPSSEESPTWCEVCDNKVPQKCRHWVTPLFKSRHFYFCIMVLPNDDVFMELRTFFEIFFSKIWWINQIVITLLRNQSISVPTKCAQTPIFFWCTDISQVMFVLAQISVSTNYAVHWQTTMNHTVQRGVAGENAPLYCLAWRCIWYWSLIFIN